LSHALHWIALAGGDWRRFNEACARHKVANGMGALIDAVAADGRPDVRLNRRVRAVEQTEDGVRVVIDAGEEVRSRSCIVTLPLNVVGDIDFTPGLPERKRAAVAEGAPAGGFKAWIQLADRVPSSLCMASGRRPLMFLRSEAETPTGSLLSCYGPDRSSLDLHDEAAVTDLVREWLPGSRVAGVWLHDWCQDEFSRQTWRIPRPGQLGDHQAALEQPHGRVMFAGADYARGWCGFMDGAVETGLRAARDAHALLGSRVSRSSAARIVSSRPG
jgi:monoamine oxidase